MNVGIVIDTWKLPIFHQHLTTAGLTYAKATDAPKGTIGLIVTTDTPEAIATIVRAANTEAAKTKKGHPDAN